MQRVAVMGFFCRRAAIVLVVVAMWGTGGCASREVTSRPLLAANPSRAERRATPRTGQDPADKLRNAVRSLREGLAAETASPAPVPGAESAIGSTSSPATPSGTSGSWSSVEVTTPDREPATRDAAPRTWLTLATRQPVPDEVWWGTAALIVIGAAMLALLIARRRRNA